MAGRTEYVIAHPNGEETLREVKGGKAPAYATWALMDGEWVRVGWSYSGTLAEAQKRGNSDARKCGYQTTATRVLPTR